MNKLTDVNNLKLFFKHHGFKPRDYLGQNFLIDENVLSQIIKTAELKSTDVVLEVGPGLGVLTQELLRNVKQVIAVEKDKKLYEILKKELFPSPSWGGNKGGGNQESPPPNLPHSGGGIKFINEDILRFHLEKVISGPYKVVANIPYYLTSKLFQYFLEQKNKPELLVLMIQKEVGERVIADVGDLSILGISVQIHADVEIAQKIPDQVRDGFGNKTSPFIVPKTSFWPVPKVDSVVLKITPREKYLQITDHRLFFRIVKVAFAGKRKQVLNSLSHGLNINKQALQNILSQAGINASTRPQDISIQQWIALYEIIKAR